MTRSFTPLLILLFITVAFLSCNEQKDKSSLENTAGTGQVTVETDSLKTNPGNQDGSAASPVIIRSAVPPGWYFYTPDTLQVSQYIRRIFQDSNGKLWFGTVGDGACCYDGSTLTYYTTLDGFSGNNVQGIAEDKYGNIWFGTTGGVTKYDGTRFTNFTKKEGLGSDLILSLLIDKHGTIWAGTEKGACCYNGETFARFPGIGDVGVNSMIEDKAGNIWFATNGKGVYCYDGSSVSNVSAKDGLCDNSVNWILQDKAGNTWFATRNGVSRYDLSTSGNRSFTNFSEDIGFSFAIMTTQDRAGNIWISGKNGVCRYDGRSFTSFGAKDGLTNVAVQSIYEDRTGNLWFGSGNGLFRFDGRSFTNVTKKGPWPEQFQ